MFYRLLQLDTPGTIEMTRGRLNSTPWRAFMGLVFALSVSLALNSFNSGLSWLLALWMSLAADYTLGKKYLAAGDLRSRIFYGQWFALFCAINICLFACMAIYVGVEGGAHGRVLGVLMVISTLLSAIVFFHQAPAFMLITAVPCTLCLALLAALPISPAHYEGAGAEAGLILGMGGFMAYVYRSAVHNSRLFGGLQAMSTLAAQRQAEAEARRAEAEDANRVKSDFMRTMTHELRTPLNAVIGYAEIIAEDMAAEGRADISGDAERIQSSARHLLRMIDQILLLPELESGKTELVREAIDVRALLEEVIAEFSPLAKTNGNRIDTQIAGDVGVFHSDRGKLRAVVAQVLQNAAKFTREGRISVHAVREFADNCPWLKITVADTGVGMTSDDLKKAFLPFQQADASMTRRVGGVGMGLAIARGLAHALGGILEGQSQPGVGSTFILQLKTLE